MRRHRRILAAVTCATTLAVLVRADAAEERSPRLRHRAVAVVSEDGDRDVHYFGVMGEVRQPGVYADERATPLLVDIVRRAGGLTADATGNVRIVRHGRSGQQTFYSPTLDFRLVPGDLLIADGPPARQSPARSTRRGVPSGDEADAGTVPMAFLNLVDRPIVLRVPIEYATVPDVVRQLKQPAWVSETVRVIETRRGSPAGSESDVGRARLSPGSVLVFDPAAIQRDRLPPDLPRPIEPVALHEPVPQRAGGPATGETPPDSAARTAPDRDTAPHTKPPAVERSDVVAALPLVAVNDSAAGVARLDSPRSRPTAPAREVDPPSAPPAMGRAALEPDPVPAVAAPTSPSETVEAVDGEPDRERPPSPASSDVEPKGRESRRDARVPLVPVGVALGLAILCGGIPWWRAKRLREAAPTAHAPGSSPPAEADPASCIDDLIANRCVLLEEPVVLPSGVEFFGRTGRVSPQRVDEPHVSAERGSEPNAPHFGRPTGAADVESETPPPKPPRRSVRFDAAHDGDDRVPAPRSSSRFDRALAAVRGSSGQ